MTLAYQIRIRVENCPQNKLQYRLVFQKGYIIDLEPKLLDQVLYPHFGDNLVPYFLVDIFSFAVRHLSMVVFTGVVFLFKKSVVNRES